MSYVIPCPPPSDMKHPETWPKHDHYCLNTPGETQRADWHVCGAVAMKGKRCQNVFYHPLERAKFVEKPLPKVEGLGEPLPGVVPYAAVEVSE